MSIEVATYPADCTVKSNDQPIEVSVTVKEDVIKQPFEIIKAANNGKTNADLIEGAGFTAWLASSLSANSDGSY